MAFCLLAFFRKIFLPLFPKPRCACRLHQLLSAAAPIGDHPLHLLPEGSAVVVVKDVAKLVYHHIVDAVFRRQHQPPAEVEPVFTRTGTPSSLCSIDAQRSGLHTQPWCKMFHPALQHLPGNLTIQLLSAAL